MRTTKKIICVWIGTHATENEFYQEYLKVDYEQEKSTSKFGTDAGLPYYDEDYMESWWFEQVTIDGLKDYQEDLLDAAYFFDDLLLALQAQNLNNSNTISFLFGAMGANPANEFLFDYTGMKATGTPIKFIFKKEYEL